jgi:hypothetical protein
VTARLGSGKFCRPYFTVYLWMKENISRVTMEDRCHGELAKCECHICGRQRIPVRPPWRTEVMKGRSGERSIPVEDREHRVDHHGGQRP